MVELYDKNNTEHNDRNIYEVVEWGEVVDSRHPDSVEVGTLEEDMLRRDFTVNNIGWNPRELIISVQSVDDILDRKLRFVGDPEQRLKEDMLRGWRFMRLAKTKNLTPDKDSLRAVRRNWENIYNASNPHRVMLELEKLCLSKKEIKCIKE